VVANPSSYLYLDNLRLKPGVACVDADHCKLDPTSFAAPDPAGACPGYNAYKYGLDSPAGYIARVGADRVRAQYPARHVVYLLGELDSAATQVARYDELDRECSAELQGPAGVSFRMQRGLVYQQYVNTRFGAKHKVRIIPGCGHSESCMFSSPRAARALFPGKHVAPAEDEAW
jgi:hypothetical protein